MKEKTKKKTKIALIVAFVLIAGISAALVATNPSDKSKHWKAVEEKINNEKFDISKLDLTEEEQTMYTSYMSSSGTNANIMDKVVSHKFDVENYGFYSVGYIKVKGWKKKISTGFLNKVSTIDANEIAQAILEAHRHEMAESAKNASQQPE